MVLVLGAAVVEVLVHDVLSHTCTSSFGVICKVLADLNVIRDLQSIQLAKDKIENKSPVFLGHIKYVKKT